MSDNTVSIYGSQSNWQDRIAARTGEPAVPVLNKSLHRVFWVPKRYVTVVAVTMDGKRFTMRPLAKRTGYSVKGVQQALWSLHEMGIGTLTTARGCNGFSRFIFNRDCNVSTNATVSTTHSSNLDRERPLVETFHLNGLIDALSLPSGRLFSGPASPGQELVG